MGLARYQRPENKIVFGVFLQRTSPDRGFVYTPRSRFLRGVFSSSRAAIVADGTETSS